MNFGSAAAASASTIVLGDVDGATLSSELPVRLLSVRSWDGGGAVTTGGAATGTIGFVAVSVVLRALGVND